MRTPLTLRHRYVVLGRAESCKDRGELVIGDSELRRSDFSKGVLGAFLVGTSSTYARYVVVYTETNMHIVNNIIKWFEKETFRSLDSCSIDISTADGSTTLEIKGGGTVPLVLKSRDGFPITVLALRSYLYSSGETQSILRRDVRSES